MPVLRRSHEHHRDLQARLDTSIPTAVANRDQDRYVMITFSTSQMQNLDLPCRPSIRNGGARANLPLRRQRRHRSSSFTADSRSCDRPIMRRYVVSQHTHRDRLPSRTSVVAQISIARCSPRHRLQFPAGSFLGGFRTPASVQAAPLRSAGIRNPQQTRTWHRTAGSALLHSGLRRLHRHVGFVPKNEPALAGSGCGAVGGHVFAQ